MFIPLSFLCRENRTAYNLEWLEEDTKLRYSTAINYTWDPETSAGNPDKDMVVTINTPLIVSSHTSV